MRRQQLNVAVIAAAIAALQLSARGQGNQYVEPPPPKVTVQLLEQINAKTLPPGAGYEWTAMSYQEKIVGGQMFVAFSLALLLVYLVLAGQYESWYAPASVILAVPLALLGPVSILTVIKIDNNLYVQIGLVLLIALSFFVMVQRFEEWRAALKHPAEHRAPAE